MADRPRLGELLCKKGLLDEARLASALSEQQRSGGRLGAVLVRLGMVEEGELVRVLGGQLGVPVARIRGKRVAAEVLGLVPAELAEKYRCLPLFRREESGGPVLFLAMEDPTDREAIEELAFQVGERLRPVLIGPVELEDALQRHYREPASVKAAPLAPLAAAAPSPMTARDDEGAGPRRAPAPSLAGLRADPGTDDTKPEGVPAAARDRNEDSLPDADLGFAADFDDPFDATGAPEPFAGPPAAKGPASPLPPDAAESLEPALLLRALAQLLVEKGVIGREEFAERLRILAAAERGS